MKKLIPLLLTLTLLLSLSVTAHAAFLPGGQSGYTEILTEVPACTWTLEIPADTSIAFGTTEKELGTVQITNIQNKRKKTSIEAFIKTDCLFRSTADISDPNNPAFPFDIRVERKWTDPFTIRGEGFVNRERTVTIVGMDLISNPSTLTILVDQDAWDSAPAGKYATYLQFTSRIRDN